MKKLILLHGALGADSLFDPLKTELEGHFDCYNFNFSGHGRQAFNAEGFGIDTFAAELKTFIQAHDLAGSPVFGYSMGGYVALYLASQEPGLISGILTLGTKFGWNPEAAAKEAAMLKPEVMTEKVPAFTEMLEARHGAQWKALVEATAKMMIGLGNTPLLTEATLSSIDIPVTIGLGEKDRMVSQGESTWATQFLASGSFQLFENTPHPLEKVDPKALSEVILDLF